MIKHLKKILNDKSFIKQGERSKSVIKWKQPENIYHDLRILLRKEETTIGLARIEKNIKYN